ncbi:MAG: hypothetical protein AAGJ46_00815 [Planctomycetota bacterium]
MAHRPEAPPASPGMGLATCAAAALLLSVLGYAVATQRPPAELSKLAETAGDTLSPPLDELFSGPAPPPTTGRFAPWPQAVAMAESDEPAEQREEPENESIELPQSLPSPPETNDSPATPTPAEPVTDDDTPMAGSPSAGPLFAAPGDELAWTHVEVSSSAAEALLTLTDPEALRADQPAIDELLDTPAPSELSRLLRSDVQQAYALGRSGAVYAARQKFIGVLRKVASAKDSAAATDRHTQALAAGLRALEEANAFLPKGDAVEADLDVAGLAASHRTPLYARQWDARGVLPHEAIARYHRFAQHKLSLVASGDEAASMALHGLGKSYARLAALEEAPLAEKTALTMFRAAVEAHPANYLAANELGVGLARIGKYEAAEAALAKSVAAGAGSTVYRNLAVVQAKLGRPRLAQAATTHADRLAQNERSTGEFSRQNGVKWVPPGEFTRVADAYRRRGAKHAPALPRPEGASPPAGVTPNGATRPAIAANRPATSANADASRPRMAFSRKFAPLRTASRTSTDQASTPPSASRNLLR